MRNKNRPELTYEQMLEVSNEVYRCQQEAIANGMKPWDKALRKVGAEEARALEQKFYHRQHYLSANARYSALTDLNLNDARIRRRAQALLEYVRGQVEFSQGEVDALCGHRSNRNTKVLRRVFIELPYFPSRKLGEVKMFKIWPERLEELEERLRKL